MTEQTKEITQVKGEVSRVVSLAQSHSKIATEPELQEANEVLVKVKAVGKRVTEEKKKQLDPANATVKSIRDFWAPIEAQYQEAERIIKDAILSYSRKLAELAAKKEAQIEKKVEEGKMTFETGLKKIENLPTMQTSMGTKKGMVGVRKVKKFEVEDLAKLPLEYHLANETKIRQAMHAGQELPGVKYWEEETVSVTAPSGH